MADESRFIEQILEEAGELSLDQQVLPKVHAETRSVDPEHQDAEPPRGQSAEPTQQSPPSAQQPTEPAQQSSSPASKPTGPVGDQAPPANTSSTGLFSECATCGKLVCTCSASEHNARPGVPPVNTSSTHTQAQASTSSAPQTDEDVSPTESKHIGFAQKLDNRKEVSTSEKSLPMLPDQQALYTAAVQRVNLATTALEEARMHSVEAYVTLRSAQANVDNTHSGSDDQALKDAQSAVSRADKTFQQCLSQLNQAHITQSKAESDARLAGSVAQQSTSQSDAVQGKETWKGKGRAEESESESSSSSSDEEEQTSKNKGKSSSADGKKTRNPLKIVGRALRRRSSNEQHSSQQPGRSKSEPKFHSPNPSAEAHVPKPDPPVKGKLGGRFGLTHATTTSGSAGDNAGGSQIGTTGGSTGANHDGAGDGNGSSSQPVNRNDTGNSQRPVTSQGTQTLPAGGTGGTGKKPGLARRLSSDMLNMVKKK